MSPRYKVRFFFDYGTGNCLWSADDDTDAAFGYPIDHRTLPLSPATIATIDDMLTWYDTSLNWEYPPDPGPWRQAECERFNQAVAVLFAAIQAELGDACDVLNEQPDLSEDPDLDAYLRDPHGFRRE